MKQLLKLALLFLTIKAQAQNFDSALLNKLDNQIEKYVEANAPGIAVGIVNNGVIVYRKYIGYANLEHNIKINEKTKFNIASNAKQFTAQCILKLVEEGRIKLEDDFRTYLPDLYPNIEEKITISNLITHTSGIRDIYDLWALKGKTWWKLFVDNNDAIEILKSQKTVNFKPGSGYIYSNSNYILLTEIVKKITGKKFSDFALTMFKELGMPNTQFATNYMAVIPNRARPYGNWNGWRDYPTITELHGDGALYTTLNDQLKWEQIIQLNNGEYLSKQRIEASQLPIKNSYTNNYGYGLMLGKYKGLEYNYHDGNTGAYNATFLRFPAKNLSIVVNSNNANVPTNYLAKQLTDIVLGLPEPELKTDYPENPEKIEKLKSIQEVLGIYKGEGDNETVIRIVERNGMLYREIYQRNPDKLINLKNGLFQYENIKGLKINFRNIGRPDQKFTLYKSTQKPSTYYKVSDLDFSNYDKNALNGTFYNEETDTKIILNYKEGNRYSLIKNGRERKAQLILEDYLRMMGSYKIKVIKDKENNVIGLNVKNGRIENVIFNKI